MKVAAVIVTYNGSKWIDKCINSLLNSTQKIDVFIVDNCSTDGTQHLIKKYNVEFIQASENKGFGVANNIAIELVLKHNPDFIFLLNQDAWVETNTLEQLINISKNYTNTV